MRAEIPRNQDAWFIGKGKLFQQGESILREWHSSGGTQRQVKKDPSKSGRRKESCVP